MQLSCGYHLRSNNNLAENYPVIYLELSSRSLLKRSLSNALISSGVELKNTPLSETTALVVNMDKLRKVIQSIGVNNQVQEYRLEYDVEYRIGNENNKTVHLEKDYSFDVQQIGGGQQEELTLRKQLAEDMAWAIIRQLNVTVSNK